MRSDILTSLRPPTSVMLVLTAMALGCSDHRDAATAPEEPGAPGAPELPSTGGVLVSNPSGAGAWVAILPDSFTAGRTARVSNPARGAEVTVAFIEGAVDPVAIPALAGDTLLVAVDTGGPTPVMLKKPTPKDVPPKVVRTEPQPGKLDVPLNTRIIVVFSEPLDSASLSAGVRLHRGALLVPGSVGFEDASRLVVAFTPAEPLAGALEYVIEVTDGIRDLDGQALEHGVTASFVTAPAPTPAPVPIPPGLATTYERVSPHATAGTTSSLEIMEDGRFTLLQEGPGGVLEFSGIWELRQLLSSPNNEYFRRYLGLQFDGFFDPTQWFHGAGLAELLDSTHIGLSLSSDMRSLGLDEGLYARPPIAEDAGTPPAGQVAFVRDGRIWLVTSDGSGERQLTEGPADAGPAWSRDGTRLAFSRAGVAMILDDVGGADQAARPLADPDGAPYVLGALSWSPDSRWLVGVGQLAPDAGRNVYRVPADPADGVPVRLTPDQGWVDEPAWSPDGSRIAFTSDWAYYDAASDVQLVSPDGTAAAPLLRGLLQHAPAWSPDGSQLAVTSCPWAMTTCVTGRIEVFGITGGSDRVLVVTGSPSGPTWSADGSALAYASWQGVRWVRADGSQGGLIVADGHSPAWRP